MRPVSVLVVDDNSSVRAGLRGLLAASPDIHVVGEAWDGERAVELTRALQPDVVLLDVRMPRRDGVSAAAEIALTSKVLMLTFTEDHEVIRTAVDAGASGYLVHGAFQPDDLVGGVLAVARGSGIFSVGALDALRGSPAPAPEPTEAPDLGLSTRQTEILELIAEGLSNGEIADRCFLSEKTVKNHINRIFATLGVRTRSEAIALWFRGRTQGRGR
ncbi:DNA-binding response regulator [Kineosporia sp. NBRC 101677]|uniref:response regulator n=1 Tax=Kineosporia sp. NBRC 101677 TaxID=3032197 RepID=UPI0024A50535|nr:response regulator transcription factor [Kineosporia sp. NBRC 101677]GLY13852.1 DNA-binding response regulator [Kineosporia sp. NBRC 101677]